MFGTGAISDRILFASHKQVFHKTRVDNLYRECTMSRLTQNALKESKATAIIGYANQNLRGIFVGVENGEGWKERGEPLCLQNCIIKITLKIIKINKTGKNLTLRDLQIHRLWWGNLKDLFVFRSLQTTRIWRALRVGESFFSGILPCNRRNMLRCMKVPY